MLRPLLTRILNHVLSQNSWAKPLLRPYGGKTVRFVLIPIGTSLTILEDGGMAASGETALPDATITIPPSVALRLLAGDESAISFVRFEGDTELAAEIGKILRGVSWDYEEDMSKVIGDVAAHKTAEAMRHAAKGTAKQVFNAAEMVSEYWQEEQPLLAKKRHVETFNREVDDFRDNISRLEKQFHRAASRLEALVQLAREQK